MKNTIMIKDEDVFQKVITKGSWYGGNFLSVYVLQNNKDFNMIGLGVGKKAGKAVQRNHVKRLIKEAYKELEPETKSGFYIVFVWKSKAEYEEVSFNGIKEDLLKTFKKAGLI